LLLENVGRNDPNRSDLEQIKQAGQRATALTSQLLAFSRRQILQPRILNLNDVITDMSKMLRRMIGEDIEFVCITRPGLGFVHADLGQIQQIIMNLVVNARDAMPQGGKLTIETANVDLEEDYVRRHAMVSPGPFIMLAISDDGIGMDAETQARIFEPFFTTKERGKGTGLGLSTVYGIVKQSNGFIWIYSEPGKGTTFKIYLPRVPGEAARLSACAEVKPDLRGAETVLLVEDEASVRTLACRILRERGYTVLEGSNGKEALRVAQEFAGEIHLVLTDVVMPEMSGKTLVTQIEAARPGIKALFISGYTDNAIVHHGILESNVAFLQKPFSADGLARKVREVIDS
jgi:two-component system cell cycle sensor histidine kinase/response regulator CckA